MVNTFLFVVLISVSSTNAPLAESAAPRPKAESAEWVYPVVLSESTPSEWDSVAVELRKHLCISFGPGRAKRNPGCCLFIETAPQMSPSLSGYIVFIGPGGGTVIATSLDQAKAAATAIVRASRPGGMERQILPFGVMTNYKLISDGIDRGNDKDVK